MKNILAALLISIATSAFAVSPHGDWAADPEEDTTVTEQVVPTATEYERITSPIVHIGTLRNAGTESERAFFSCSGFYVGGGLVVTAGHCLAAVAATKEQVVRFNNTQKFEARIAMLSNPDWGMQDFGILRLIDEKDPDAIVAKLDCSGVPLSTGDAVTARGYPYVFSGGGEVEITTTGKISAGKYVPNHPFWSVPLIRHQLPIDPGFSGGALYADKSGLIVGITVAVTPGNHDLTLSQPISPVCKFLGLPEKENVDATQVPRN